VIQRQLCDVRAARRAQTSLDVTQKPTRALVPILAGEAARPVPQAWAGQP
jgi:hypothetical protein